MFLIASLIPLLVFSVVSVSQFISFSNNNIYQLNNDKLEIVKAEISGMLDKHFITLHTIAKQPAIRDFDLENGKKFW